MERQPRAKILPIVLIFLAVSMAWSLLGETMSNRSGAQESNLSEAVGDLWGREQTQPAPELIFRWIEHQEVVEEIYDLEEASSVQKTKTVSQAHQLAREPDQSDLSVDLSLDERRKGLVWFPLYNVNFRGDYAYTHRESQSGELELVHRFPTHGGTYDAFVFEVNGQDVAANLERNDEGLRYSVTVAPGETIAFSIGYASRGLAHWSYRPFPASSTGVLENFTLSMTTDFEKVDFPADAMSPTNKAQEEGGWALNWEFDRLITARQIGMVMPTRIQPGELGARLALSAPISLGLFFLVIYVLTMLRNLRIHAINYAFLGAAFFSFHLLFAYSADRLNVVTAFSIAGVTSIFLVVSYLRLVVSNRFAFGPAALAQGVYLIGFALAHFWEGYTGLSLTVLGIITLYWLMQATGRMDWFEMSPAKASPPEPLPTA
jgi:inner membrane protein involved in colicin E2 resistance